jgi:hypothetical protein
VLAAEPIEASRTPQLRGLMAQTEDLPVKHLAAAALLLIAPAFAQAPQGSPLIDYDGFARMVAQTAPIREARLVSLKDFKGMALEEGTIVLDARSREAFAAGHIRGAVNLPFTEFTQAKLDAVLGSRDMRVLIYCNNNFIDNAEPVPVKSIEVALNVQTFVNLRAYGFENIYELGEAVTLTDPRVGWVALK